MLELGYVSFNDLCRPDWMISYEEPVSLEYLHVMGQQASKNWWRLYCNSPGLFVWHNDDDQPLLQRLAKHTSTKAFQIDVYDSDSIYLLESDGHQYCLTGAHHVELEYYFDAETLAAFTPGTRLTLNGLDYSYQSLEVDARIIEELLGYDFGNDLDVAISDFEASRFQSKLVSYDELGSAHIEANWYFRKEL